MNAKLTSQMTIVICLGVSCLLLHSLTLAPPAMAADEEGFVSIFDGKSLEGWDGNPKFWRVEEGAIVGQTTKENPTKGNTFLIWRGGQPGDFELRMEYRLINHNSGIQYRSFEDPEKFGRWVIGGYQADIAENTRFDGILYGEKFRGILAMRGEKTVIGADHKPRVVGKVGESDELLSKIKRGDWNSYSIIAEGYSFVQKINDQVMVEVTDEDLETRRENGLIALQLHAGPPMRVEFRNIRLKTLGSQKKATKAAASEDQKTSKDKKDNKKKVVLIAGTKSHGYGSHEHNAGCLLLAKCLEEGVPNLQTTVYQNGWPKESDALQDADAIVIFCDGGGRHPINAHLEEVAPLIEKGVGLGCLHYGVEVPKGEPGDTLLQGIGGYFEAHWSVNPHWVADFKEFPEHPITRGVKPFRINDEWYYHMRFPEGMKNVTPILTAVPPDSTRDRPDGAHSNNPTVRARKGMPEHMMWAIQRPDGGRGFGFTGGHYHWSWGDDSFRTVVLNAIVWIADLDVPAGGVPSKTPTLEDLKTNQDYPPRKDITPQLVRELLYPAP